jgi:hypothetical protein
MLLVDWLSAYLESLSDLEYALLLVVTTILVIAVLRFMFSGGD